MILYLLSIFAECMGEKHSTKGGRVFFVVLPHKKSYRRFTLKISRYLMYVIVRLV